MYKALDRAFFSGYNLDPYIKLTFGHPQLTFHKLPTGVLTVHSSLHFLILSNTTMGGAHGDIKKIVQSCILWGKRIMYLSVNSLGKVIYRHFSCIFPRSVTSHSSDSLTGTRKGVSWFTLESVTLKLSCRETVHRSNTLTTTRGKILVSETKKYWISPYFVSPDLPVYVTV